MVNRLEVLFDKGKIKVPALVFVTSKNTQQCRSFIHLWPSAGKSEKKNGQSKKSLQIAMSKWNLEASVPDPCSSCNFRTYCTCTTIVLQDPQHVCQIRSNHICPICLFSDS